MKKKKASLRHKRKASPREKGLNCLAQHFAQERRTDRGVLQWPVAVPAAEGGVGRKQFTFTTDAINGLETRLSTMPKAGVYLCSTSGKGHFSVPLGCLFLTSMYAGHSLHAGR